VASESQPCPFVIENRISGSKKATHASASVFINHNESGLHQDFERWLEKLAPDAHNTGEDNADVHLNLFRRNLFHAGNFHPACSPISVAFLA
jgi:hypothetical protein